MTDLQIRAARRTEAPQIAEVLARAFHHDPLFSWMLPVEASRLRRLRRYFLTELRHESLRHSAVDLACADGRIAGAAVWFPPSTWSSGTQLSALPGYVRAFGRRLGTAAQFLSIAAREHPREQPHWYLAIIGVDPPRQGRGVGAALLRSRLEHCDSQALPAYLESSKLENVPLYEHFGFRATGALHAPEAAPVVTTMWRPA